MSVSDKEHLRALSILSLNPSGANEALAFAAALNEIDRQDFLRLADSHHVTVRALTALREAAQRYGDSVTVAWCTSALEIEGARIGNALTHLRTVVSKLEANNCPVVVMKSLDHWPDIGNDLDLYSSATPRRVVEVFTKHLNGERENRSWGDRLANKWNFKIPGLPESVECHVQRLGQTGEHIAMAQRFIDRRVFWKLAGFEFPVPAPEERVIVATLQRLYRHFYFRVCDIVNTAGLVESRAIDYSELRRSANLGGVWPGVCTYLNIVSDYVKTYRGTGLDLPSEVTHTARFGGDQVVPRNLFLRVPIMPYGASLYTKQVATTALHGNVAAMFRLSLLPPLASVAALAYRVTGSDKGIW